MYKNKPKQVCSHVMQWGLLPRKNPWDSILSKRFPREHWQKKIWDKKQAEHYENNVNKL